MLDPLISVIVPIYGIDRYVGQCIESIINQSYGKLEIILVDDGGQDRCPEICDLYSRKDSRVKVIHKSNGGLVSARKAGLMESSGAYVGYVDGDDWIAPGFVQNLCDAAISTDADMVCAGYSRDLFAKSELFYNALSADTYDSSKLEGLWGNMASYGSFYRPGITTYVWNKLFRREILLQAQMEVDDRISLGEDGSVTYPALLSCSRVVVTENTDYHYRQREDSMLKQSIDFFDDVRRLRYLYDYMLRWADADPMLQKQVTDYVLSLAIIRLGGRPPRNICSVFDKPYYGNDIVIYSAGTFGQQLVKRIEESGQCRIVAWLDDDYWEYRRCCLDVDPVESITKLAYDYVLIAAVDEGVKSQIISRLLGLGVEKNKILGICVPEEREELLKQFLDMEIGVMAYD